VDFVVVSRPREKFLRAIFTVCAHLCLPGTASLARFSEGMKSSSSTLAACRVLSAAAMVPYYDTSSYLKATMDDLFSSVPLVAQAGKIGA
jgi:hypothetical protein